MGNITLKNVSKSFGSTSIIPGLDLVIENGEIVCPYHMGRFDIRTGEATGAPCSIAIRTYNVMMGERRRVAAALIAVP